MSIISKNITISKGNRLLRWDITKGCNLNCKHCITSHMYDNISELSKEEKLELIRKAANDGVTKIHLLGGDPLILPYIDEVIEECTKNNIYVSLNTNGHRLDKDIALCELFAKNNVGVSFSVDGGNKNSHDIMRGNGSFDIVMKAAENYGKAISKYEQQIISAFYITLTPDNMNDDFSDLFAIAQEYHINNIILGVLIPKGAGEKNYDSTELTVDRIISKTEDFVKLGMNYKDIKVSFPYQTPLLLKYLNDTLGTDYGLCYTKCKAGITDYQLQIDGSIFPCVYINDPLKGSKICDPQEIRSNNNFLHHSIEEIVKNDFFTPFYECLEKPENFSHVSPCNKCPYCNVLDICRPCAHQHIKNNSDVPEFHRNKICEEILVRNGNNFYFNTKNE